MPAGGLAADDNRQVHRHRVTVYRGDMPPVRITHMAVQVFVHIQLARSVRLRSEDEIFLLSGGSSRHSRPQEQGQQKDRYASEPVHTSTQTFT